MGRFKRLRDSVERGDPGPPLDQRYLRRPCRVNCSSAAALRSDVFSFLAGVYESQAETLPDVRDAAHDPDVTESNLSLVVEPDPYAAELNKQQTTATAAAAPSASNASNKQKKKKSMFRTVTINQERAVPETGHVEKWLPPGQMMDLWHVYKQQSALEKPASFVTFWRVSRHFLVPVFAIRVVSEFQM